MTGRHKDSRQIDEKTVRQTDMKNRQERDRQIEALTIGSRIYLLKG